MAENNAQLNEVLTKRIADYVQENTGVTLAPEEVADLARQLQPFQDDLLQVLQKDAKGFSKKYPNLLKSLSTQKALSRAMTANAARLVADKHQKKQNLSSPKTAAATISSSPQSTPLETKPNETAPASEDSTKISPQPQTPTAPLPTATPLPNRANLSPEEQGVELKKQQQKARLQKTQRVSRRPPEFATPPTLDSADETGEEKSDTAGKTIPPISMLPAEGNEITPEQQSRAANVIQRMQQIARQAGLLPAHPQKQKPAAAKPEVAAATKQAAPPLTGPGSSIFLWEALSTVWFDFSFVSLSYIHIHFFAVWFSQGKILGKRFVEPDGLQTVVFGGILLVELFIGLIILTLLSILVAVYNAVFSSWGWDRFVTVYSLLSEIPFTKILFDWLSSAV